MSVKQSESEVQAHPLQDDTRNIFKVLCDIRAQLYTLIELGETNKRQNRELIEKIARLS